MKIMEKGNLLQKIISSSCLIILLFNILYPISSYADEGDDSGGIAGVLVPIITFFVKSVADSALGVVQYYLVGGPITRMSVIANPEEEEEVETLQKLGIVSEDGLDKKDGFDNSIINWGKTVSVDAIKEGDLKNDSTTVWEKVGDFFKKAVGLENDRNFAIPMIVYSPESIFANKIRAFDINFINPDKKTEKNGSYEYQQTTMGALQENIATWYNALRMLAAALMLPILIYVGIRIIISSASEKAKYKEMLMDWVVAMCLLFVMHYIMAFIINMTDAITNVISSGINSSFLVQVDGEKTGVVTYFQTNLTGLSRFRAAYDDFRANMAYTIMYVMMVVFTLIYTWIYFKRSLMIAFLTVIAPIITLTYPLDKLGDGRSQGFDMWLKEYFFNALIQPIHLILYMVLVGGAVSQASEENPILAIAAMAFILPAEKLIKKMFDFDKASTGAAGSNGLDALLGGANLLSNAKQSKMLEKIGGGKSSSGSRAGTTDGSAGGSSGSGKIPTFNYNNVGGVAVGTGNRDMEATQRIPRIAGLGNGNGENEPRENRLAEIDSRLAEIDEKGGRDSLINPNASYTDMYMDGNNYMENEYDKLQNERAAILAEGNGRESGEQVRLERGNDNENEMLNESEYDRKRALAKVGLKTAAGVGKKVIKAGVGTVGGLAGATAGLSMGLASGDLSKATSMMVKGAGVGAAIPLGGYTATRWVASKVGKTAKEKMDELRYAWDPVESSKKDSARKSKKAKKEYMRDAKNYRAASKMAGELGLPSESIPRVQEQMYELNKYQVSNYDEQKKAVDMINKYEDSGLDTMSAASLVHENKKFDYSDEKTRQKRYNSFVEQNAQTMGVENAQRVAQQRMNWQGEMHGGKAMKNVGRNYSYTGKNEAINRELGRNKKQ